MPEKPIRKPVPGVPGHITGRFRGLEYGALSVIITLLRRTQDGRFPVGVNSPGREEQLFPVFADAFRNPEGRRNKTHNKFFITDSLKTAPQLDFERCLNFSASFVDNSRRKEG